MTTWRRLRRASAARFVRRIPGPPSGGAFTRAPPEKKRLHCARRGRAESLALKVLRSLWRFSPGPTSGKHLNLGVRHGACRGCPRPNRTACVPATRGAMAHARGAARNTRGRERRNPTGRRSSRTVAHSRASGPVVSIGRRRRAWCGAPSIGNASQTPGAIAARASLTRDGLSVATGRGARPSERGRAVG